MLINKLLRFALAIFFCLLPFSLIGFLSETAFFFFIFFYAVPLVFLIQFCFPRLGKSKTKPSNNKVSVVKVFKLFSVFFFFVAIVIIGEPFMPPMFQERFAYVMTTVMLEVGILAMIVDGSFNVEVTEEQEERWLAEAEEYFKNKRKK